MHLIRNVPATFIIRVQGKSMVDVGINDGDLLVVDKSLKPKNFSTVIAITVEKFFGFKLLSTTNKSPSLIPTSTIDFP